LHSDGVQAFGKIPVDLQQLGVDLYSVSGHKVFAPKGIGGLFVKKGVPLRPIQLGGRHERSRRAGTENVPAAIAFARAVSLCSASSENSVAALRDAFESGLRARGVDFEVNGAPDCRLPNTSNILFRGVSAEALVIALDMKGIAVSTGSACSSGSVEPSHVLLAMGLSRDEARSSVRFSFGRYNTPEDVKILVEAVSSATARLGSSSKRERLLVV
jgi:cysteine desulfurase